MISKLVPSNNAGTQIKTHAEIGDNKKQQQIALKGSTIRAQTNNGKINGRDNKEYKAQQIKINHNNGLSWKEMVLILGIVAGFLMVHRVPWKFWKKKKNG